MRWTFILTVLTIATARAQSPVFDVASVKSSLPSNADRIDINLGTLKHGVVTLTNTTLSECVQYAYGLVSEDQISGPDWIRDRNLRVDITAKTSPDTPLDEALLMMQTLLAQRFHMELHREPKPVRHLELTVGKKGLKLPVSQDGAPLRPIAYGRGRLFYDRRSLHSLALLLSRQLKQPVLDLTGLTGFYDVHLEWAAGDPSSAPSPAQTAAPDPLPDIFGAVEQQLGLHLESTKTPIEVIVIDRADKVPVAN
jgi:uncharacterized protein (TIGR03435 family)